jgi:Kef-type K+ transport system membrane component KefB
MVARYRPPTFSRASLTIAAITISPGTFLAIVGASAVAGALSAVARFRGLFLPTVVLELVFGVIIGPHVLGLKVTPFISFFADLGLGMLFFFAGYEIDFPRIRGLPLRLGMLGWALSLGIAYTFGGILASGHMRPSTAAALVGAAALSTLVYPILGLRVAPGASRPAAQAATPAAERAIVG